MKVPSVGWALLGAVLVLTAGGCGLFSRSTPAREVRTEVVRRGDLVITVTATGHTSFATEKHLSFGSAGEVLEVRVKEGQPVREGEVLARLDPEPLEVAVTQARDDLRRAEKALEDYLDRFSQEKVDRARATVRQAEADLQKAKKALEDYLDRFSQEKVDRARATVRQAEADLQKAERALEDFLDRHALDLATAQARVAQARVDLQKAEKALARARDPFQDPIIAEARDHVESAKALLRQAERAVGLAQASLETVKKEWEARLALARTRVQRAEDAYQDAFLLHHHFLLTGPGLRLDPWTVLGPDQRPARPVERAWEDLLQARLDLATQEAQAQQAIRSAENALQKAQDDEEEARRALRRAQDRLDDLLPTPEEVEAREREVARAQEALKEAERELARLLPGPDPVERAVLEASIEVARARLSQAQEDLDELLDGPDPVEVEALEASIEVARARLSQAQEDLDELLDGPDPVEVESLRVAIRVARFRLQEAQEDLAQATITAPFDGIVAEVQVEEGDTVTPTRRAFTLVDPRSLEVTALVDEVDVARLQPGQPALIVLEGLPEVSLPGRVARITPVATEERGVVSYETTITLAPSARGGASLPATLGTSLLIPGGMTATVRIQVEKKEDVLLVPLRAVYTSGRQRMVDVWEQGNPVPRPVRLGSINEKWAEVLEGVEEGEKVVVRARPTKSAPIQRIFRRGF